MRFEIVPLPKEQWKGTPLPIAYTTEEYYDVVIERTEKGFVTTMERKRFETPVTHTPEEYDFPDKLYEEYWEDAYAWGVIENETLIAAIETCPENWSNRLRVTELWVAPDYQKQGLGHALMEVAKEQARLENRRAVILETQSCNVNAIGFYLHEGFTLMGFDSCCYAANDLERKEVRIELGYFWRKPHSACDKVEIRAERPEDYHATEQMTKDAFWNKHTRGCDEHYLVHKLREDKHYLPELSRIAVVDGEVVGAIFYAKAWVADGEKEQEIATFGPLCVHPDWHACGIGAKLLKETLPLVAKAGYPGVIIFGEPDYYPRNGFKTCDNFGITTVDGKNFDAFMGIEVIEHGFAGIHGKFHESEVFENLPKPEVEEYNKKFKEAKKQYFPKQWD